MSEIKTLADQLRSRMAKPDTPQKPTPAVKKKTVKPAALPAIIDQLRAYDLTGHKNPGAWPLRRADRAIAAPFENGDPVSR